MRHSMAPTRVSQAGFAQSSSSSTAALAKLLEKKKEYELVVALERASSLYLERIDGIGEECNTMAEAAEGIQYHVLRCSSYPM